MSSEPIRKPCPICEGIAPMPHDPHPFEALVLQPTGRTVGGRIEVDPVHVPAWCDGWPA